MDHRIDPEQYARLMDAAERRAHELRRQAMAAFWADAARLGARAWRAAWHRVAGAGAKHHLQGG